MNSTIEEKGNYLRLVAEGTWEAGYRSVDEFLRRMGVDTGQWIIKQGKPNSWPTTGWNGEENAPWTVINHQVSATLLRKEPIPLAPQVQPVTIKSRKRTGKKGRPHHGLHTALAIFDPHFGFSRNMRTQELTPFHDRRVLDIAVQLAHRLRPETIVWGGDMLDLPDWSDRFIRSPEFYWCTQPAVVEAAWWVAQMRTAVPPARIIVTAGNHDARMEKALLVHLNQAYQLRPADEMALPPALSIPRLLALHRLDVEYVDGYPDADVWLNDGVVVTHGDRANSAPGATAGNYVRNNAMGDVSMVFGHVHRHETASRTTHGRDGSTNTLRAVCPGCACRIDGTVPGSHKSNWQQGLAVIRYDGKYRHSVTVVPSHEGEALFEGEIYQGEERLKDLMGDTGWEF